MPSSLLGSSTLSSLSPALASAGVALSHPTVDIGIIFTLLAGGLFWAFVAGRRKVVSTIMLTYIALALFPALPIDRIISSIGLRDSSFGAIGAFLILFIVLAFFLGARRGRAFGIVGPWWQTLALSFLQVGLLIHIVFSLLADEKKNMLSGFTRGVFTDPSVHLWWLLAPILFLVIIRRLSMRED
ncbi:MAG: hypothetical protein WAP52_03455 [Candidatus Sungiibacteriota bacterium]